MSSKKILYFGYNNSVYYKRIKTNLFTEHNYFKHAVI